MKVTISRYEAEALAHDILHKLTISPADEMDIHLGEDAQKVQFQAPAIKFNVKRTKSRATRPIVMHALSQIRTGKMVTLQDMVKKTGLPREKVSPVVSKFTKEGYFERVGYNSYKRSDKAADAIAA